MAVTGTLAHEGGRRAGDAVGAKMTTSGAATQCSDDQTILERKSCPNSIQALH